MNIFAVHPDPEQAARELCDQHVVKMVLETAQILSTVALAHGYPAPYRPTHPRHPCVVWAGASAENWGWLYRHGLALAREYTARYGRRHAAEGALAALAGFDPAPLPGVGLLPFAQAMPEAYRGPDPHTAYRRYYVAEKLSFARWRHSPRPTWAR